MKVSVIVPNFNHARFLRQRIDSILAQEYADFELILLDDKSTDESREVIESYRHEPRVSHIIFNEENSGSPFLQWEKGLKVAQGEYIWIAESDDYAHPNFLKECVNQLDKHPDAALCHTGSIFIDGEGKPISKAYDHWQEDGKAVVYAPKPYIRHNMTFWDDCYNASKVLFRRSCYERIAKTYTTFRYAGDWLFMVSLILQGDVISLHRKLNYYRWHTNNVTSQSEKNTGWLTDKIRLYAEILRIAPLGSYHRWLVCGLVYKYIARIPTDDLTRKSLFDMAEREMGIRRWHYLLERTNKTLANLFPCLPAGKKYYLTK